MGFWSAGDEEFDRGDIVYIVGEHGEKIRCGFIVLALVEGVDDDERPNSCFPERPDDEFLHLGVKGVASDVGARD